MTGILGFYAFGEGRENWNAPRFLYYGLNALQGRGQESASIATYNGETHLLQILSGDGMVDDFYKMHGKSVPEGFLGIGQVSAQAGDYVVHVEEALELMLVGDGNTNLSGERTLSFKLFAELLSQKLSQTSDPLKAAVNLVKEVGGGYSFIALTKNQEMICGRDVAAVKPLEVGAMGFDIGVVASETSALDVIGAEHTGSIMPGEVVVFDPLSIRRGQVEKSSGTRYCSFEYVYLARLDSSLNGISVAKVRNSIGQALARERPIKTDVVVGVPETALPFATSFSEETGIPIKLGFARTGRHTRSAIKPTQFERLMGVQLKLNPVRSSIDGRDIMLIDDSVVRGNTLKNTVIDLKRKGARRVHVRVGSPAIVAACPFGTEVPPQDELIGRSLSEDEITKIIGADSFAFLSIDGLVESIGKSRGELCLKCFGIDWREK